MLSVQSFSNNSVNSTFEADEIQSSSSTLSLENKSESLSYCNYFYPLSQQNIHFNHLMMEDGTKYSGQQAQNNMPYQQYEWSGNKSAYSQLNSRRSDSSSTLSTPMYTCYETPVVHDPCTGLSQFKQHPGENYSLDWFNTTAASSQASTIQSLNNTKGDNDNSKISYDAVLSKRSSFQRQQVRDYENYLPFASQAEVSSHHASYMPQQFSKGRILDHKFHPRYKSAHARFPPYTEEHKETASFQTFLSPPIITDQSLMDQGPLMLTDNFESKEISSEREKNNCVP
ncbi:hypothetical protein BD560DRAFT_243521 [Blakeslea trispora]|nr:hypothetical protein BD560DRAFT_243521 [Blakeslea trispora]